MAITNRELPAGTTLVAKYKGKTWKAQVLIGDDGSRGYQLLDDNGGGTEIFRSPSSAGSAVMNGTACNGWRFWSIEGDEPQPDATPKRTTKAKAEAATPTKMFRNIKKTPNQRGVPEGQARWYCSSCQKGFMLAAGEEPSACPEGHAVLVEDELAIVEA
jgi:hypothetical protein